MDPPSIDPAMLQVNITPSRQRLRVLDTGIVGGNPESIRRSKQQIGRTLGGDVPFVAETLDGLSGENVGGWI